MLDRFGNTIWAGFTEHEILRIEAALTLDRVELTEALHDIAAMSGRSFISVRAKAYEMQREAGKALEAAHTRTIMVPSRKMSADRAASLLAPSELNTSARMRAMRMGARA